MILKARQLFSHSLFLFFLLALVVIGGTILYVSSEHTFYTWDNYAYQLMANETTENFQKSFVTGLDFFSQRLQYENNVIYALPLVPFLNIFGTTRVVYETAMAALYLLPYLLVLGAIGRLIIPGNQKLVFWITVGVAIITPVVSLPLLRGYPDTGAALLFALAVLLYLGDIELKQMWRVPTLGVLLGLATIFRRHFAYDVIAFFGAAGLVLLVVFFSEVRTKKGSAWNFLFFNGLKLALAGGFIFITLIIIAPIFVFRGFNIDYNRLYASYMKPWYEALYWYSSSFGWLAWLGAGVGIALMLRAKPISRGFLFITLFGILSLSAWVFFVRQESIQYNLHFAPVIVLGLSALLYRVVTLPQGQKRRLWLGLSGGYIALNLMVGLLLPASTNIDVPVSTVFTTGWAPITRQDYNEVVNLVNKLRELTPNREAIFVVASSGDINPETLNSAERDTYGKSGVKLNIITSPDIDSRDFYPMEPLYKTEYVVVIDPFQHHMAAEQQGVVRVSYDMFMQNQEIAKDFTLLPFKFNFANNITATIYKRKASTTLATTISTFKLIKSYSQWYPAYQIDWIALTPSLAIETAKTFDDITLVSSNFKDWTEVANPSISFLYADNLPAQINFEAKIKVEAGCSEVAAQFMWVDDKANTTPITNFIQQAGDSNPRKLSFPRVDNSHLMMKVNSSRFNLQCPLDMEITKVNAK